MYHLFLEILWKKKTQHQGRFYHKKAIVHWARDLTDGLSSKAISGIAWQESSNICSPDLL
jgi:hypothetical protein